ncbi:MAG: trkA2 [Herbinix sp.]|jgi:trk system potassium uptake protein TrkA|nr:trkA2 [Herbinix sp.]
MYIIIIGCGRFGSNLAKGLSDDGNNICVVERNAEKLNTLGSGFNGLRVNGIEFDSDNLIEAGIENADALIAVTADDNINITVSLIADKIYKVPKIIARVNDPEKNYFYEKLGIDTINPINYELEMLKSKLPIKRLDVIAALDDYYEIIEILVNREKSMTVGDIEDKYHCIISSLVKGGKVSIPKKNNVVYNGDSIICTIHKNDKGRLISHLCKEMFR